MTTTYEQKEKELLEELEKKYGKPILRFEEVNDFAGWQLTPLIRKKWARKPLSGIVVRIWGYRNEPYFDMRWVVEKGIVIIEEDYVEGKLNKMRELISWNKTDSELIWKIEHYHENGNLKRRYHLKGDRYHTSIKFGINEEYNSHGNLIRKDPIVLYHLLIKKKDGLYYEENSNKPFTGICDDNDWIGRMNAGKKEGYWYPHDHDYAELYKEGKLIKSPNDDSWGYWEEQEGLGNPADLFK